MESLPRYSASFRYGEASEPNQFRFDSEWVLPDGLGGFAMGTVAGVPMRRYHGLLCVSLSPPVLRMMMLNACDEMVIIPKGGNCGCDLEVRLTGFQFPDQDPPLENPYLSDFTKEVDSCQWVYLIPTQLGKLRIRKTLTIADGIGGCRIGYDIESGLDQSGSDEHPITLEIRPLLSMRDFHELNTPWTVETDAFELSPINEPAVEGVAINRKGLDATLSLRGVGLSWTESPCVWRNISYQHDAMRHQDSEEDLMNPGVFTATIHQGKSTSLSLEATVSEQSTTDWAQCSENKRNRIAQSIEFAHTLANQPENAELREAISKLVLAADDFIVYREKENSDSTRDGDSKSVIAGYPWFSDWGRDTMIALPGLYLCTGRFDEAKRTLLTFAQAIKHGLIPNRFDDAAGSSHYNTVDASLWFIHACDQWSQSTNQPIDEKLIQACDQIINAYIQGTIHNIKLDPADGLISAGDETTQLTWMDALRDGVAFTPRHGKAIEINALWINALIARSKMGDGREECIERAELAKQSMITKMGVGPCQGLVDCVWKSARDQTETQSTECRPNQAFAVALEYVDLPRAMQLRSLESMGRLVTPIGMRTLHPEDPNYCAHYRGSMTDRDRAYHNGTAWPWLLGSYCEAYMRTHDFSESACKHAQRLMLDLVDQMNTEAVGQLFEIYDAEPTHNRHLPQGCMAQAWSIAEALRILILSSQKLSSQ